MSLSIALATRGRPALLIDTLQRTVPHIVRPDTVITVMADADDKATIDAVRGANIPRVVLDVREREDTIADKFNRALDNPADAYLPMVDHTAHLTPGFDQKILDAGEMFPDGIGLIVNHLANESFTGIYAVTRNFAKALGYVFPPYFPYWFVDHWLDDVARIIQRVSYAPVQTDSSKKPGTQEMREPAWWPTFYDAGYLARRKQAFGIMQSPDFKRCWRDEQMMLPNNPLLSYIEIKSRRINDSVRAQARDLSFMCSQTMDDRYLRIKQRAEQLAAEWLKDMNQMEANAFRAVLFPPTSIASPARAFAA